MVKRHDHHRIVVAGGGYAGMIASLRLAGRTRRLGARVTLVSASERFVERIRLHQAAAGQPARQRAIPSLLHGTGVAFMQGRLTALDPDRREVTVETTDSVRAVPYDSLVYALGSTIDVTSVPGVREHAYALGSPATAAALQAELPGAAAHGGHLVVCGGGLTGIEAAAEIAEAYPGLRVSLVTRDDFGAAHSAQGRKHLHAVFERLGIAVHDRATVTRVRHGVLEIDGQPPLPFDLCLWAASFSVPALARGSGLAVNERGQILVDPYLRSLSHPSVYGAGDAATPAADPGAPIRMACATAMPMGAHAADTVTAMLRGRPLRPFRFAYVAQCISLGRRDALVQFVNHADSPKERIITGRLAARVKEWICRYTIASLNLERRWAGSYRWPGGPSPLPLSHTGRGSSGAVTSAPSMMEG